MIRSTLLGFPLPIRPPASLDTIRFCKFYIRIRSTVIVRKTVWIRWRGKWLSGLPLVVVQALPPHTTAQHEYYDLLEQSVSALPVCAMLLSSHDTYCHLQAHGLLYSVID